MHPGQMHRALFLDRDGTVIEDRGYMRAAEDVVLLPGAGEVLPKLAQKGWKLIVISNQSGVGRGIISRSEMQAVQTRFLEVASAAGIPITGSYFCPHTPGDNCICRKPSAWLLQEAARDHNIDLNASFMIGDRNSDIFCGKNAGCATIWLRNLMFSVEPNLPTHTAANWQEIDRLISGAV